MNTFIAKTSKTDRYSYSKKKKTEVILYIQNTEEKHKKLDMEVNLKKNSVLVDCEKSKNIGIEPRSVRISRI